MFIRNDIKKTKFYNELLEEQLKILSYTDKKFIPNIDTLYYSVFFKDDKTGIDRLEKFFEKLEGLKLKLRENKEIQILYNDLLVLTKRRFAIYEYCLAIPDLFDIYIADYLPNSNTPRVVIQLRSFGLWLESNDKMINDSFNAVKSVFKEYDLDVDKVSENRIDYCYHTNHIQEAYTFFGDKKMERKMETTLDIYQKIGHINKNHDIKTNSKFKSKFSLDYFALGQRKSNSLFIRHYNKSREVIEEGYKSFFFAIWHKNKLISDYDLYCYSYAFEVRSYMALDKARLQYYLDFGDNKFFKCKIKELFENKNTQYKDIKILADMYLPKVTLITNIEFQTKRKFYYNAKMLKNLPVKIIHNQIELVGLYQIIDNKNLILDYITSTCLSYGKREVDGKIRYDNWWERLRGTKLDCIDTDFKFARTFMYERDKAKIARKVVNGVATYAVYNNSNQSNFVEDISDLLGIMNDNDKGCLNVIDIHTGEIINEVSSDLMKGYNVYKEKKSKLVKNRKSTKE
jgi:hypothetical protein